MRLPACLPARLADGLTSVSLQIQDLDPSGAVPGCVGRAP